MWWKMSNITGIIESLQNYKRINESINPTLVDRFMKYCKASNAKNINYVELDGRYYVVGISDKRFEDLVKSFIKANDNAITFKYSLDGSTEILKLETNIKI